MKTREKLWDFAMRMTIVLSLALAFWLGVVAMEFAIELFWGTVTP